MMSRRDPNHDTTRQIFENPLNRIAALYKNRQQAMQLVAEA
jgi:hypothetical protein